MIKINSLIFSLIKLLFLLYSFSCFAQVSQLKIDMKKHEQIEQKKYLIRDTLSNIETPALQPRKLLPNSEAFHNKYKLLQTYIPQEKDTVKYININFNIFQDYNGKNNFAPYKNKADSVRLMNMFLWVNEIFAKQPFCEQSGAFNSDPPIGVEVNDLKHKYIQFKLKGIYVYKDAFPDENLWKSNDPRLLLSRISETDSTRLDALNICFTEKYFMGSVRHIEVINGGQGYAHPIVLITGGSGEGARAQTKLKDGQLEHLTGGRGDGAKAMAIVKDGKIERIDLLEAGNNYKTIPRVVIKGGNGKGATAEAEINEETGKIVRINVTDPGRGYDYTLIDITNGAQSSAKAYVEDIKRGRINKVSVYFPGLWYHDDPDVEVVSSNSKARGASLKAHVKGATGFTRTPHFTDADLYIIEKSIWNNGNAEGDYASATNIAHELGHVLDLYHTYQGGNETNNVNQYDYLVDVFGKEFLGFHLVDWGKDPCESTTDRITNNLMGGNQISQYTSPMQIGKMHRALHLYNVKKYTDCQCDLNKTWQVETNELWDFDFKLYSPIVIKKGQKLTLNATLEMPDMCDIVIEEGAELKLDTFGVIKGGCNQKWRGKIIVKNGGILTYESIEKASLTKDMIIFE